jgi:hypothetical protein
MGIANTDRVSAARVVNAPGSLLANRRHYARPYTEFTRGGINRFRPPEAPPKLFRVA